MQLHTIGVKGFRASRSDRRDGAEPLLRDHPQAHGVRGADVGAGRFASSRRIAGANSGDDLAVLAVGDRLALGDAEGRWPEQGHGIAQAGEGAKQVAIMRGMIVLLCHMTS